MKPTLYLVFALILALAACGKRETIHIAQSSEYDNFLVALSPYLELPPAPFDYTVHLPDYLKAAGEQEPVISNEKAAIGRVLFYDKNLSQNGKTACISCHNPVVAFADVKTFSSGNNGLLTLRNAPSLANTFNFASHYGTISGQMPLFSWDNHIGSLEDQLIQDFEHEHEMNLKMTEVVERVKQQPYYQLLWDQYYKSTEIRQEQILECLAAFVGSISANASKFDVAMEQSKGQVGELRDSVVFNTFNNSFDTFKIVPLKNFSFSEYNGLKLFNENCAKCHAPIRPLQEVFAACNGLDLVYADQGLGTVTGNPADNGVFKAPPLRNIALTDPYMHDGRFKTLEEVVEFYSTQVKMHPNLHPAMIKNGSTQRNFTITEKIELVYFLQTLTDIKTPNQQRFLNPFK